MKCFQEAEIYFEKVREVEDTFDEKFLAQNPLPKTIYSEKYSCLKQEIKSLEEEMNKIYHVNLPRSKMHLSKTKQKMNLEIECKLQAQHNSLHQKQKDLFNLKMIEDQNFEKNSVEFQAYETKISFEREKNLQENNLENSLKKFLQFFPDEYHELAKEQFYDFWYFKYAYIIAIKDWK